MNKFFLLFCLLGSVAYAQDKNVITPGANLIADGIPALPASLQGELKNYTESRSAGFAAWHPKKKEMIISTRFGNVPQLHMVSMPLGDRKQLTFFDEPVGDATFEPINGDYFLFTKDIGGNEFSQIFRYDVADKKITMLTDGKRSQNGGIVWSRQGGKIAYGSTMRNGADRDIYIMDPQNPGSNKMLLQVQGGGWSVRDWSPDGRTLLVGEYISANESYYWLVDVATGYKQELTGRYMGKAVVGQARFDNEGRGIYFITDRDNEFQRLAYMNLATKHVEYFTNAIKWDVEGFSLSKDNAHLAFITNEAGESKLYLMNTASRLYTLMNTLPKGVYGGLAFHKNNEDLAIGINSYNSANDVYVLSLRTGRIQRWTESEMGGLDPGALQAPRLIKWKSFDSKEISGFCYRPAAKFTGKRPVMIVIHGGPEGQSQPGFLGGNNFYLNELGVAMIYPNVRGSSGYGKTFLTLDNGFKREESVKDIGALLDWIERQPDLDASRVMVTGGSYGGYMTLAVATNYNDRIRCALDVVGISHFGTFLKNTESYRRDLRRVEYGDERDKDMASFFEKISPLNNAANIMKPLFIVQGGNDPRVPRTEAAQMADKVKKNGGTVWYLEAKDEGHGFRKKNNIDFQRYATVHFIRTYLLDGLN